MLDKQGFLLLGLYLIAFFMLMLIGKLIFFKFSKNNYLNLLFEDDYLAASLTFSTFLVGLTLAFLGNLIGENRISFIEEAKEIGIYSSLSLTFCFLSLWINDKILLRKIDNAKAIKDNNIAVALSVSGSNIATGVILMSCFTGSDSYVLSAVIYFIWSQLLLIFSYYLYEWITPYNFKEEIKKRNIAVGLGIFGNKIAISIIVSIATWGDFVSWEVFLKNGIIYGIAALFYVVISRFIFSKLLFPGINLNKEISEDKNTGTGLMEGIFSISVAAIIHLLLV